MEEHFGLLAVSNSTAFKNQLRSDDGNEKHGSISISGTDSADLPQDSSSNPSVNYNVMKKLKAPV